MVNWKKFGKKASKTFGKTQKWIGRNINPDVLDGSYGMKQLGGFGGGGFDPFGEDDQPVRKSKPHHRHRVKSKSSSRGKSITIRFD